MSDDLVLRCRSRVCFVLNYFGQFVKHSFLSLLVPALMAIWSLIRLVSMLNLAEPSKSELYQNLTKVI